MSVHSAKEKMSDMFRRALIKPQIVCPFILFPQKIPHPMGKNPTLGATDCKFAVAGRP